MVVVAGVFSTLLAAADSVVNWGNDTWSLQLDPATGALVRIENKNDPQHMNWLREAGHWAKLVWVRDTAPDAANHGGQWGLVETARTGLLCAARLQKLSENSWESIYTSPSLTVTVRRELTANDLVESYTFRNTGPIALDLPLGSASLLAPLFDQYPDASVSMTSRCHAHLWMGGSSAWINATRMGTTPPHFGLVVTEGSLDAYSQRDGTISDRGTFLLHPASMSLEPGKTQTIAWRLFWHTGWDDFFSKLKTQPNFTQLTASRYVVKVGEPLEVSADSVDSLTSAQLLANGQPIKIQPDGQHLKVSIPTSQVGDVLVELINGDHRTWLRANVIPAEDELIDARVKFIVRGQQRHAPGDILDGAYLPFDNETGQQVYAAYPSDHNAGRERLGMGVLGAMYLPFCHDEAFKTELLASLRNYAAFVNRELEDETGIVYGTVGRKDPERLYNYPWIAHFHVAMYQATGDKQHLDQAVRVLRNYYARGGGRFYAIGLPITDILTALATADRDAKRRELLDLFRRHADFFLKTGINYPHSEVNFEQSIVAPAVQLLLEVYQATREPTYLEGARQQLTILEAFCGRQPDHRLNEIAIRHWDDYWFGKARLYGDTFPHYWSALNATTYAWYARATGERVWFDRAHAVIEGNLSLFSADGHASCAHVYPLQCNSRSAAINDPWANDQDWALVSVLQLRAIENSSR